MTPRWSPAALFVLAVCFTAGGLLFIPRMGIEVDEALVGAAIYPGNHPWYSWRIGQDEIPVMLISYLGALKGWFYNALFWFTPPRPMSLRLPTLLAAAATLWMFFAFLARAVSRRSAWIGTLLLATDTSYLLMNTIDYGPVTVQFVCKLAALALLVRFHQAARRADLAGACFLLGLAMWDKAIFAWVLFGLTIAAAAVFPRELRRHLSWPNLRVAVPAFVAGALPLIVYNIARPLETFRANAQVEQLAVWGKSVILTRAIDGYVFFGFMTAPEPGPLPGEPGRWYQSLSFTLSHWLGEPRHSLTLWATAAAIVSLPLLWRTPARRPGWFALIAGLGTWVPMVLTAGAGAAAQHVLLIWPFHLMLIAAALAVIPNRALAGAATVLLCASGLAVTNQYYKELIRNGPAPRWTDAMDPLHRYLTDAHAPRVYVADWGILETMHLLSEGGLPVQLADLSGGEGTRRMLAEPGGIFVAHTVAMHPQERTALEAFAREENYIEEPVITIHDRNGRPAFDVFRFRKLHL